MRTPPCLPPSSLLARWSRVAVPLLLLSAGLSAADLVLVQERKAVCTIVADEGIAISEKTAVTELQRALKTMSGAEIPVAKADGGSGGVRILIGQATVKRLHPEISFDGLGTDGFIVKTGVGELLVAGGTKRGTLYAAFEVLRALGWRWWAPGATRVPRMDTVVLPDLDRRQVPALAYRDMLYAGTWINTDAATGVADHTGLWKVHNRINGFNYSENPEELGGRVRFDKNLVHTYASLMQPVAGIDSRIEVLPEVWSLRGGKRTASQPCLTNPKTSEIMLANVVKQLTEHPEYEFVVVGQEDNNNFCQCPSCSALAEAEGSQSGPVIALANKIGEAVEQRFPGMWVQTPAYMWSRKPPKTIKPRRNVGITLCSIECDFNRPIADATTPSNASFAADLAAWGAIAPRLYIWNYQTNFSHFFMPFPNLDALVPDIQSMVRHGTRGILQEASRSTLGGEFAELRAWMLAEAMWDPAKADGKALIAEFTQGYYGPAAPHIQAYIDIIHGPGRADPAMRNTCTTRMDCGYMTPAVIADAEAILRLAEAAVASDAVLLQRVRLVHLPTWYMLMKRGPQSKAWAATVAKVGALDPVAMVAAMAEVVAANKITQVKLGEDMKYFMDWATDYARQCAQKLPLPPELATAAPGSYRLIQACQMDDRPCWWVRDAGASDGWAAQLKTVGWRIFYYPSQIEDIIPGKTYAVSARVRSTAPATTGDAFTCGAWYGTKGPSRTVAAADLADGAYHAIELMRITTEPGQPVQLWFALKKQDTPTILLDCLWLQEVTP